MIQRFTTQPFKLYCITDDASGLNPNIEALAIPDIDLEGWWYKLSIFQKNLYGLSGDILFLDLDVVITSDLTPFFEYRCGEFAIIRDLGTQGYNSSVFRVEVGSQAHVWESFLEHKDAIIDQLHGDQDWITKQIPNAAIWPDEWVASFKKQCNARIKPSYGKLGKFLRRRGIMLPKDHASMPPTSKIIQFHGKPDPEDVMDAPYGLYKSAPWIKDYWK